MRSRLTRPEFPTTRAGVLAAAAAVRRAALPLNLPAREASALLYRRAHVAVPVPTMQWALSVLRQRAAERLSGLRQR